jgi:hypothetical protein
VAFRDGELAGAHCEEEDVVAQHTVADPFYPGLRDFLQTPRGREVALSELSQMLEVARAAQRAYDIAYGAGSRVLYGTAHEWGAALSSSRTQPQRDLRRHVFELVKSIRDTVTRVQNGLRDADSDGLTRLELVRESIAQAQQALTELTLVVDATLLHGSNQGEREREAPLQSGVIDLDAHR